MSNTLIHRYPSAVRTVKTISALALLGAMLTLSACNTTAGAGQDVSAAGRAVTDTAVKVKQGI